VAVKIIEHHEQGSAISSGGKRVNVGREAMLSTTISHPNVVSEGGPGFQGFLNESCSTMDG
jgi:hypothetical protein